VNPGRLPASAGFKARLRILEKINPSMMIPEEKMAMNLQKILLSFFLALVLILTSALAFASPPQGMFPPRGLHPMMMGPSGLTADKQHLYVVAGPRILEYSLADLKLVKSIDLPKSAPPKLMEGQACPPPHPPMGGAQLWAGDGSLYVLAGPMLYRFSTPDLTLKTTAELPKPVPPQTGK
jgi:hypothetical protein